MEYDTAVVGAGPVGSMSAIHAQKRGDALILGVPDARCRCAGLVSTSGLQAIGAYDKKFILNTVRGARIFSPGGVEVEVDAKGEKACVIDRVLFDKTLFERALDAGCENVSETVTNVKYDVVTSSGKTFSAGRRILATGADYSLHKTCGLTYPKRFLTSAQYELEVECDRDFVELYFNVPGFFSWLVPVEDSVRVGLATWSEPVKHLNEFIKFLDKQGRLKSDRIFSKSYGPIPIYEPSVKTQCGECVSVGDAAGQVKATSGGGIVFGCLAAMHACEGDYERLWRRELGGELRLHLLIHNFLNRLSPEKTDRLFSIVAEHKRDLESSGDMDYASKTVLGFLRDPGFVSKFLANAPGLLLDIIR